MTPITYVLFNLDVIFYMCVQTEALQANVERLKAYKAKLVVFPRKSRNHPKKGDSSAADTAVVKQLTGAVLPIAATKVTVERVKITDDLKNKKAHQAIAEARKVARMVGIREKRAKEAAEGGDKKKEDAPAAADE